MHVYLPVFTAAGLLSNSEPLLLIGYARIFIHGGQKKTSNDAEPRIL